MRADLREYLSRIATGWDDSVGLDLAVASVERFVAGVAPLVLFGRDQTPALARRLCQRVIDDDVSVLGPDVGAQRPDAVLVLTRYEATRYLDLAALGSGRRAIICVDDRSRLDVFARLLRPITVPTIQERAEDIGRIIASAMEEAARRFDTTATAVDSSWVLERSAKTITEIETGAERIVAMRAAGSVSGAARILGMSGAGLITWFQRRRVNAR